MLDGHLPQNPATLNPPGATLHKEWCPGALLPRYAVIHEPGWNVSRVTMHDVARDVCRKYELTLAELCGPRRRRREIIPRQEFTAKAYELPHVTYPMIGRFLNQADHTSAINGRRQHLKRIAKQLSPALQTGQVRAGDDA